VLFALERYVQRTKQALAVGFVFGLTTHLFGYAWLIETLRVFARFPVLLSAAMYALVCVVQCGQLVLFVLLVHALKRRGRDALLLSPLCLGAAELAYPQLFPNYFAASLHRVPLLLQGADLGGPIMLSMLLALSNAGLCRVLLRAHQPRAWRLPLVASLVLALALGYGALRIRQVDYDIAAAPALSIAVIQANQPPFQKREDRNAFRQQYVDQSKRVEQLYKPELLIWPETALQYVLPVSTKSVSALLDPLVTPVLFGGLAHRVQNGKAELYNSAYLAAAGGGVLGRADKQRLIPFAEYIPFGDVFPRLYDYLPNTGAFTRGQPRALPFRDHRIAALICYEDVLAGHVRDVVRTTKPDLIVNLSNDVWFGRSAEPYIHHALAKLRAVEHRRTFVRADNVGISAVIDPVGRVVARTQAFTAATLRARVALLGQDTLYDRIGDAPAWLATLIVLLALLRRPRAATRSSASSAGAAT
jgi:apolipoprotein N-acyltransferase